VNVVVVFSRFTVIQLNISTMATHVLVNVVIARWRHCVRQTRTGMNRNVPVFVLAFPTASMTNSSTSILAGHLVKNVSSKNATLIASIASIGLSNNYLRV